MKSNYRYLVEFVKLAAAGGPALPSSVGGTPNGPIGAPNPIQKMVAEQQAVAQGQATPQGNPEVLKMQEAALQAQQQGQQQAMAAEQQAQQAVAQAQQQVAQAEAKAQQQASGQIQRMQSELDKARADKLKAEGEAEIAKVEAKKTEVLSRENKQNPPDAPPPDYNPLLKRLGGRVGKAVSRLQQVAPALKLASAMGPPERYVPFQGPPSPTPTETTPASPIPAMGPPAPDRGLAWNGPPNTRAGFGQRLQHTGTFNNDSILTPRAYAPAVLSTGLSGEAFKMLKNYLYAQPDYSAHFRTDPFSVGGGHAPVTQDDANLMGNPNYAPDYMQLLQSMLQNGVQGAMYPQQ